MNSPTNNPGYLSHNNKKMFFNVFTKNHLSGDVVANINNPMPYFEALYQMKLDWQQFGGEYKQARHGNKTLFYDFTGELILEYWMEEINPYDEPGANPAMIKQEQNTAMGLFLDSL